VSIRTVKLVFLNGPEDGKELTRNLPVVFGRQLESDVPIPYDALASRRHAQLDLQGDEVVLEDLDSRNGTFFLTGQPVVTPTAVGPGTLFRVGGIWLRLVGVSVALPDMETRAN
jgi:pSer/pThr/pTyr-binding forkhead associated (FHA) protein